MKTISFNRDEDSLVGALKTGDRNTFEIVVSRYHSSIIRVCRGYTGSDEDARDLAQEVFVELYRSIGNFKGESSLSSWLYRIAINKSLNFIRDNRKRDNISSLTGHLARDIDKYSGLTIDSDRDLINSDHKKALYQSLAKLPEKQRTAFILNKYDDIPYTEIGDIMKLSLSSVESLIFRAKKNLQKNLFNYYKENLG